MVPPRRSTAHAPLPRAAPSRRAPARPARRPACALAAVLLLAPALGAQPARTPSSQGVHLAVNLALHGASAGVVAWRAGRPLRAVVGAAGRGALAGTVTYAGQRLVGVGRDPWRLVGLQVVGIGSSAAVNVGRGTSALSELTLPLYPAVVTLRPHGGVGATLGSVRARLSASSVLALGQRLADREMQARPDWSASLRTGQLVLRSPRNYVASGQDAPCWDLGCGAHRPRASERSGIVVVADGPARREADARTGERAWLLSHEMGHVAQQHRELVLASAPLADAALGRAGRLGRAVRRVVVLDAVQPLQTANAALGAIAGTRAATDKWYERESLAMTGDDGCGFRFARCR